MVDEKWLDPADEGAERGPVELLGGRVAESGDDTMQRRFDSSATILMTK